MTTSVRALATSTPPLYVTQEEAWKFFSSHFDLKPAERDLYRRILLHGPIHGRYFGMDSKEDACETNPDRLNERFLKYARLTASEAARKAMASLALDPAALGGIVVNTCTGYLCPGLSSYLVEDLGLADSIKMVDIAGMGCGGAIPSLECAAGLVARGCRLPVLSLSVEICSSTIFMGDDPALIVSNSIFGDGAAACIMAAVNHDEDRWFRLLDFETGVFPQYREHLRYRQESGRLRNVLTRRVPILGAQTSRTVLNRLLQRHDLSAGDIRWWAVHAGGTAVLEHAGEAMGLNQEQLRFSAEIFRDYGNMSSPTVLFALENILKNANPHAGDKGILISFGAGFSAYACLIEF
jgi:predicted naringenin-chalcone synthase